MKKRFARWLFIKTHAVELHQLHSDATQAKSLGISKRTGIMVTLQFLGLW